MDAGKTNSEFDRLLRPCMDRLYRFAHRLAASNADAEDLFQDVLTKIYSRLADIPDLDDPGSWLCRVMYNHFIDNRRRFGRRRLVSVDEGKLPGKGVEEMPGGIDPGAEAERADDIMCLDRALSQLSDEQRLILMLHDVEGYKLAEIQKITGEPPGTVKSRLHRARARLRKLLATMQPFADEIRVSD